MSDEIIELEPESNTTALNIRGVYDGWSCDPGGFAIFLRDGEERVRITIRVVADNCPAGHDWSMAIDKNVGEHRHFWSEDVVAR